MPTRVPLADTAKRARNELPRQPPATPTTAAPEAITVTALPATDGPPVAPLAAASAASGNTTPSLMDSEATRRAIREVARSTNADERSRRASGLPPAPRADERLGQGIEQAGIGDCAKGDFAGGGMGILSLPFFLIAEARGKCRR